MNTSLVMLFPINLNGVNFELDIKEEVDFSIYLGNHDAIELEFFLNSLDDQSTFLDIGANIGFYSLMISHKYPKCRVLAVEADYYNYSRLCFHAIKNNTNIECFNFAISANSGKVQFQVNEDGNRGGSGIATNKLKSKNLIEVDSLTLLDFITQNNVNKIDGLKLDIEGFEYPVLSHFFTNSSKEFWPKYIIVEAFGTSIAEVSGSPVELLVKNNYKLTNHTSFNYFFTRIV